MASVVHQVLSHKAFVFIRNDWNDARFRPTDRLPPMPEAVGLVRCLGYSIPIDRTQGSFWRGFGSVMMLGMSHIAGGLDRLLFLFVLLLPAPLLASENRWGSFRGLKPGFVQLLKIVTAFTIGHSLTLIVGGFGWLRLPQRPVEILIAVPSWSRPSTPSALVRGLGTVGGGRLRPGARPGLFEQHRRIRLFALAHGHDHPRLQPRDRTDAACRRGDRRAYAHPPEPQAPRPGTPGVAAARTLFATWASLVLLVVNAAFYVSPLPKVHWAQTGIRVAGSWIAAIALLMLAFALRR